MGTKDVASRTMSSLSTYVRNNPDIVNRATDIWAENNRLSKEIRKLELESSVQIQKITQRYELCRDVLTQIFAERATALVAHYKTLDKALASDDRELIIASLKGISSIVSQNPLESFAEFTKALDNEDEVLNLDF